MNSNFTGSFPDTSINFIGKNVETFSINKDENAHRNAVRGKETEKEREKKREKREREIKREIERERDWKGGG